jgi:hypothetical protein
MISESIFEEVKGKKDIRPIAEIESLDGNDLIFPGFPVNMVGAPKEIKNFLEYNGRGKTFTPFIAHAMVPNSPPLGAVFENCKEAANGTRVIGMFSCQGEPDRDLAEALMKSPDTKMRGFGETRILSVGHSNAHDRTKARNFAREITHKAEISEMRGTGAFWLPSQFFFIDLCPKARE